PGDDLPQRIIAILSLGFFTGFLVDRFLTVFGPTITELISISLLNQANRALREGQNDLLNTILEGTPMLSETGKHKGYYGKFEMAAYHLSQGKFIEFPEMSPLSNLRRAEFHATSAFLFGSIFLTSLWFGILATFGSGIAYFDQTRLPAMLLIGILGLLLAFSARKEYRGHRENTILSLREEANRKRSEEYTKSREEAILEREERQESKRRELNRKERKFAVRESVAELTKAASGLRDENPTRRKMASDRLYSTIVGSEVLIESYDEQSVNAMEDVFDSIPHLVEDKTVLSPVLQSFIWVIERTSSETLYDHFMEKYTPMILKLLESRHKDVELFSAILEVCKFFESSRIVDAIFDKTIQVGPGEVGHYRSSFVSAVGNSHLSDVDYEQTESRLSQLAEVRPDSQFKGLVVETNRALMERRSVLAKDRQNIPRVRRRR
ncbi:MAG: hypothetical protein ACXABY_32935, partial [Candidatus Thorarchaeota archaeon]